MHKKDLVSPLLLLELGKFLPFLAKKGCFTINDKSKGQRRAQKGPCKFLAAS